MTTSELRDAAKRLLHEFHEDEASPLLWPEDDDHIRDDVIALAEHVMATVGETSGIEGDCDADDITF